jgi:ADP-ribose pyrophosphatase YjhB (NUDIX family)
MYPLSSIEQPAGLGMNFPRHDIPSHFTASGVVIHDGHILLVNHKRIGAWVPPGGHVEEKELPEETVVREILEETGIEVEIISEVMPKTNSADAFFLRRPLFVQAVVAVERGETFYHVDLSYLCRPLRTGADNGLPSPRHNAETKEARWVKLSEINSVPLAKNVIEILELLPATTLSTP